MMKMEDIEELNMEMNRESVLFTGLRPAAVASY
jgi:hypothetical protein